MFLANVPAYPSGYQQTLSTTCLLTLAPQIFPLIVDALFTRKPGVTVDANEHADRQPQRSASQRVFFHTRHDTTRNRDMVATDFSLCRPDAPRAVICLLHPPIAQVLCPLCLLCRPPSGHSFYAAAPLTSSFRPCTLSNCPATPPTTNIAGARGVGY